MASLAGSRREAKEISHKFELEGGLQLQVKVGGFPIRVDFKVTSSVPSLILHWGALHQDHANWVLPSHWPSGTRNYKQKAFQTPFTKSGESFVLTIEVRDPKICAIQFILKDEARDIWFKLNGQNFHIDIPKNDVNIPQISIPEDLAQLQAYLQWESKGKQIYTPEQEKQEFEEAKKYLQKELLKGVSLADLRKKLQSGGMQRKTDDRQGKTQSAATFLPIQHKRRDASQLLNKFPDRRKEIDISILPKKLNALDLGAQVIEDLDGGAVLQKSIFKLGDKELQVLATNPGGEVCVRLATNMEDPLILHWGLSKNSTGEWLAPPPNIIPKGSNHMHGAWETPFKKGFSGDASLQSLKIELGKSNFIGMPFVLRSDGHWIKNNGSDFYISLKEVDRKSIKAKGDGKGTVKWLLDAIAERERDAERSLMHRFNIATELTERAKHEGELGLVGILVWIRFMTTRQLTWNKNYNVKPREISAAQDKLTDLLQRIYRDQPHNREIVRLIMSSVGRGGQGDVGQRIRDEILLIQRNNDCKGGMMEEWHQKLHNNTSPDDVIICQALLDYIRSDFKIDAYWRTLRANGVTKERLASYDRPIKSEPNFRSDQKESLIRDLTAYMRTLKAVHSAADLESAIATCMGYSAQGHDFMRGIQVHPVTGLSPELPGHLKFILEHIEDKKIGPLVQALVESRLELRPTLLRPHERLKDLIFLDLALDSTLRTAIERGYKELNNSQPLDIIHFIIMVLENLSLSSDNNEELIYCLKDWYHTYDLCQSKADQWALYAKAVLDRTRLTLTDKAEHYQEIFQPSAEYLGTLLGAEQWAINIFTEEMIRAGSAASLSMLLNRLDPVLRNIANLGCWQIISPVEVCGFVSSVDDLLRVQNRTYDRPTILVANRVKGEEEIPDGVVAVLTHDMPDVLSHVSVRARNSKVCFATCFDHNILSDLQAKEGKAFLIQPYLSGLVYTEIKGNDVLSGPGTLTSQNVNSPGITLKKKHFSGRYAVSADEFTSELVGAKSCNIAFLRGKVPSWVKIPMSVALPFGVFEQLLSEDMNKDVANKILDLNKLVAKGDFSKLHAVRENVLRLNAPPQLFNELKNKMQNARIPWPGDEGENRWQQAWMAIKKVWASKWNERAYFSTRKAKIDHNDLRMAVLVQKVINADYAFVIHTTNPLSGNSSEIYSEIVKGLGETLVGAYPGRAMSFVTNKSDLKSPKILGYPSKQIGLFIKPSIIFRSDSNAEDLEGYAGAGLYDSVPMDQEEKRVLDYSSDKVIVDVSFQRSLFSKIAEAGNAIEQLYACAQDIEGVVKDGEIHIVQTRPQM